MPLEAERCESGSNGSRDWSRFCKALSEPKQGLDLLYSRGVVTFPKHRRGGMQFTKPQDRTSQNVGVAGGGTGSYLVILWCLPTAEGVDEWKWEGGSGDMAAHLRNRRPPPLRRNLGYLWGVRGDWTWAMGSTWVRPSPIFSHWLPSGAHSMRSGGQSTRVGTVTDLRVRKEHAWDLLLPLN